MQISMKMIAAYTALMILPGLVTAQKDVKKYKEEARAMREEVWGWKKPEFELRTVPAEYANASRVVIARHMEINADSKKKAKYVGLGVAMYRELMLTEVVREAVKIGDKSAVSDYSEITFTQLEKRSGMMMSKTTNVYIGVKVIKPDGSIKEINTDDVVLTKDEKKEKEAKAAIPDLQPGDIVDYFIAKQTNMDQGNSIPPFLFTFFDTDPVLNYSVHCEIGKKYAVEYRCYNGAPEFKQSTGDEDAMVLDVARKNMPPTTENNFWLSPYRQLPVIRMNVMLGYKGLYAGRINARTPGQVYKNQSADEFVEDEINNIAGSKFNAVTYSKPGALDETAHGYFKKLKKNKNIPQDSMAAELYYAYRFDKLLNIDATTSIDEVVNRLKVSLNTSKYVFNIGMYLKALDVDNKMVLLTSKYAPELKNIMSTNDITYMLMVEGSAPRFLGVTDMFSPAFYIPSYYENTKHAITLDLGGRTDVKPKTFEKGTINIPGSAAEQNARIEKLLLLPNLVKNTVQVTRNTTLKGHYKEDAQKSLVLFEDYYEAERKLLGQEKSLIEKLEDGRKSKKYADELKAAFAEARTKQKEAFVSEAKNWFDQDVTDLANFTIDNLGVRHNNPDFVYSSGFNIDGLLKKAGNNYIVEIGKVQGAPLKVEKGQRKRTLDVYAPFARSLAYDIVLQVPEGFSAEGIAALNKKVENDCGLFSCDAALDGNTVTIKVRKAYKKAWEPAANWDKLLAFIDAANEWSSAKILLKKK